MSFATGDPESDEEWEEYDKGYREAMTPTPDTSPGDDIESILMGLVVETFSSKDTRDYKRIAEAKDRLNRLMLTRERELSEKLNVELSAAKENLKYHEEKTKNKNLIREWKGTVFGIELCIAAIDAQLNKEERK